MMKSCRFCGLDNGNAYGCEAYVGFKPGSYLVTVVILVKRTISKYASLIETVTCMRKDS